MTRTLTAGQLLVKLRALPLRADPQEIRFDFAQLAPGDVRSSRGDYSHLAIGWRDGAPERTVADLIRKLQSALHVTHEGYKGGTFHMTEMTPVWADNWGCWTGTAITDVEDCGYYAVLVTSYVD